MIREPLNSSVEAPGRNVGFPAKRREFLAVFEDPKAQRLVLNGANPLELVGYGKEVCDLKHARSIGYFTVPVNGFLTDAL